MKARIIIGSLIVLFLHSFIYGKVRVDLEGGEVFTAKSKVRIYSQSGTTLNLADEFKQERELYYRLRLNYEFNDYHTLSLLYAPLELNYTGSVNRSVRFQDDLFAANTPLDITYKFNSYRATYQYTLFNKDYFKFKIGFTGKIRDAAIKVESSQNSSENTNIGFVPLINLVLYYQLWSEFWFKFESDFLVGPQGRAEDVFLGINYKFSDAIHIYAGYRFLEGGADGGDVYTFVYLHYLVLGLNFHF